MGTKQRRKLPLHSDADLILSQRMCNKKKQTNQKIKSKNNRNVASYLKACKLAIISLCHHNQELNRSTQASNNNIYKFSMGNLFFFPFPKKKWLLGSQKFIHLLHGDPQITAKSNLQHYLLTNQCWGKKGKEIWPTQQQQHLKQSVSSGKFVFICCTDYISNKDAHRLQPWGEKPHETGTRQTNSKTTRKKRSCCQGVKAERVQGLRVCLRDSGGGKGGGANSRLRSVVCWSRASVWSCRTGTTETERKRN